MEGRPLSSTLRATMRIAASICAAAAAYAAWWGGRIAAYGFGPNRSDGFPFLPLGGASVLAATALAAAAWWLLGRSTPYRAWLTWRAFLMLIVPLPALAGGVVTTRELLASGVAPIDVLRNAIPSLTALLLLLAVGWLVRAVLRPFPTRPQG